MSDAIIIIKHDSAHFFIDHKDGLNSKFSFIDQWEIAESKHCRKREGRLIIGPGFQKHFVSLMQRWGNSGHHFLMMDYTIAALASLNEMIVSGGVQGADVYCVAFFHSDEDTVKPIDPGYEENALSWKRWYMDIFKRFPSIHIEEIPYGFTLTEDYLQALFDREFPHSEPGRYRRIWKGNAQRRIKEALSREGCIPDFVIKTLEEQAAKKAAAKTEVVNG